MSVCSLMPDAVQQMNEPSPKIVQDYLPCHVPPSQHWPLSTADASPPPAAVTAADKMRVLQAVHGAGPTPGP